jgi:hypothetical protein
VTRYCKKHGLTLTHKFDDKGLSAYRQVNLKKGKLGKLLQLIELGEIPAGSIILVESIDRLFRGKLNKTLVQLMNVINSEIRIITVNNEVEYSLLEAEKYGGDFGNTCNQVVWELQRAFRESKRKSELIKAAWENKKKSAKNEPLTKNTPFWLKLNEETGKIERIKDYVKIVERMFDLVEEGMGARLVVQQLKKENLTFISPKKHIQKYVGIALAQKTLKNIAVLGKYQPHEIVFSKDNESKKRVPIGEVIEEYYPPIISEEQFLRVNNLMASRKYKTGGRCSEFVNIFQKLIKNHNGKAIITVNRPKKGSKHAEERLYLDSEKQNAGTKKNFTFPVRALELAVIEVLSNYDMPAIKEEIDYKARILELENEINAKKKKIKDLQEALHKYGNIEAVFPVMQQIEAEIKDLQQERDLIKGRWSSGQMKDDMDFIRGLPMSVAYGRELQENKNRLKLREIFRRELKKIECSFSKIGMVPVANCVLHFKTDQMVSFTARCYSWYVWAVQVYSNDIKVEIKGKFYPLISFVYGTANEEEEVELRENKKFNSPQYLFNIYNLLGMYAAGRTRKELEKITKFSSSAIYRCIRNFWDDYQAMMQNINEKRS